MLTREQWDLIARCKKNENLALATLKYPEILGRDIYDGEERKFVFFKPDAKNTGFLLINFLTQCGHHRLIQKYVEDNKMAISLRVGSEQCLDDIVRKWNVSMNGPGVKASARLLSNG